MLLTMAVDGMMSGKKKLFAYQGAPNLIVCNWAGNKHGVIYLMSGGSNLVYPISGGSKLWLVQKCFTTAMTDRVGIVWPSPNCHITCVQTEYGKEYEVREYLFTKNQK